MPTTNPPRYDLDRQFALELQGINADRAAAGKPPLDSSRQMELRGQIESELKAMSNTQDESTRGAMESAGTAMRDFAGAAVTGAADPLVKIASTVNGGQVPKLLQPIKDWTPENPDASVGGVKGIAGMLTENALMGGGSRLLRMVPKVGELLNAAGKSESLLPRMAANSAESAALPAALTAAEGGSADDVKSMAKIGGVVGAGATALTGLNPFLNRAALSKYKFDPTNPAQGPAIDQVLATMTGATDDVPKFLKNPKDWLTGAPDRMRSRLIGKPPDRVLAEIEAQSARDSAGAKTAIAEHGGPIPASKVDSIASSALDENFSIPTARKPVSQGGPTYDTGRIKGDQRKFTRIAGDVDKSITELYGRKATPGPYSPDPLGDAYAAIPKLLREPATTAKAAAKQQAAFDAMSAPERKAVEKTIAAFNARVPRTDMMLAPMTVSDLSQEARMLRNTAIPKQTTAIAAPTHATLMENTPAYRAGEQLRKGLTEAIGESANTPEGKAIIEAAYKKFSTTLEAKGIAESATKVGNKSGEFYKSAVSGSAAAGGALAVKAGNMSLAAKLFAFAAATGAPRQSALLTKNAINFLSKPKNSGSIPMLLRRMSPTDPQDEEQP